MGLATRQRKALRNIAGGLLAMLNLHACDKGAPTEPGQQSRERLIAVYSESIVQSPDSTPGVCFVSYPAWATEYAASPYPFTCGVVTVSYRSIADTASARTDAERLPATLLAWYPSQHATLSAYLEVAVGTEREAILGLLASKRVLWAHPNFIVVIGP